MRNQLLNVVGLTAAALLSGVLAGCGNPETHIGSYDDPHDRNAKVPSIEASYEMVGLGKPPLTFITYSGGYVKIIDETSNEIVHAAQIPPTTGGLLIRIDPDLKAVTYGPSMPTGAAGPNNGEKPQIVQAIDPTHRFELYYQR